MLTVTIALTLVATAKSGILISDPTISQDADPASMERASLIRRRSARA